MNAQSIRRDNSQWISDPATRREKVSAEKMAEVLRVGRQVFVERGFRGTTMEAIASLAGVSKRTLYLWHADKSALFRACIIQGARLFPIPGPGLQEGGDLQDTLRRYASSVLTRSSDPSSLGLGRLLAREQVDFPEILSIAARSQEEYLVIPLAAWLRENALAGDDAMNRAALFISMALAPVHDRLLVGTGRLDRMAVERHATLVAAVFVNGTASAHQY